MRERIKTTLRINEHGHVILDTLIQASYKVFYLIENRIIKI